MLLPIYSGDPNVPGLGFRYDTDERWVLPNPTGLQGVFEGYSPPHYKNMRDATEALAKRKFGDGGVYNPNTPGAWNDSPKVRADIRNLYHFAKTGIITSL